MKLNLQENTETMIVVNPTPGTLAFYPLVPTITETMTYRISPTELFEKSEPEDLGKVKARLLAAGHSSKLVKDIVTGLSRSSLHDSRNTTSSRRS